MLAVAQDSAAVAAHPTLKSFNKPEAAVDEQIKTLTGLAGELNKDQNVAKNHPDVATYPAKIAEAEKRTLTIDEVRHRVEELANTKPGLAELRRRACMRSARRADGDTRCRPR